MPEPLAGLDIAQYHQSAAYNAALLRLSYDEMRGWYDTGPGWDEAIEAIWNNRKDIRDFYWATWGPPSPSSPYGNWTWKDAMNNWITMSAETRTDPLQYAIDQGWVEIPEVRKEPTLAREKFLYEKWMGEEALSLRQRQMALAEEIERGNLDLLWEKHYLDKFLSEDKNQRDWRYYELQQWETQQSQRRADEALGLDYLQLLSSMRGPRDWVQYWNTVRGASQTNIPAYAEAMMQNRGLPAFNAPYKAAGYQPSINDLYQAFVQSMQQQPQQPSNYQMGPPTPTQSISPSYGQPTPTNAIVANTALPGLQPTVAQGGAQGQNLPGANPIMASGGSRGGGMSQPQADLLSEQASQLVPSWAAGYMPHKVAPRQWGRMLPSEQQGLAGALEAAGWDFEDWATQMQRSWPTGSRKAFPYYS